MKLMIRLLAILCLWFAGHAARADDAATGPRPIVAAAPYTGEVVARVRKPGASVDEQENRVGTASARFVDIGKGRSRLVVKGSIRKAANGFAVEGAAGDAGWSGRSDALRLVIAQDGRISGEGAEPRHRLRFAGLARTDRFDLSVELHLLQPHEGLPAGTTIVFDYALSRTAAKGATAAAAAPLGKPQAAAKKKSERKCSRTVWQTRTVTTPLGGMHSTQVARCAD